LPRKWPFRWQGIIIGFVELTRVAGGILWRETSRGRQVAVVHRRRQGDWSLPKGRLEPGERWRSAALREVGEETGCTAVIHHFAGAKLFVNRPRPKLILYWHMRVVEEGAVDVDDEVDDVAWVSRRDALSLLDQRSDRLLLLRAIANHRPDWEAPRRAALTRRCVRQLVVADDDVTQFTGALEVVARVAGAAARSAA
jgi:ADP-ribose pyrophosphatase YjhB (NUDIX family)